MKASRRSGINYVFNGQHTIEIVATVSGSRETPVWCMVYDELDYVQEADIFANQQKYIRPLLPYEIFMANVKRVMMTSLLLSLWLNHTAFQSHQIRFRAVYAPSRRWAIFIKNTVSTS